MADGPSSVRRRRSSARRADRPRETVRSRTARRAQVCAAGQVRPSRLAGINNASACIAVGPRAGETGQITRGVPASVAAVQFTPPARLGQLYGTANALNRASTEASRAITWETSGGFLTASLASASFDGSATIAALTHDAMNRLTGASRTGMSAAYAYDADDRRVPKSVTQGATDFTRTLWSGTDEVAEYDGANALLRCIVPGPSIDDKAGYVQASGVARYVHADRPGSAAASTEPRALPAS